MFELRVLTYLFFGIIYHLLMFFLYFWSVPELLLQKIFFLKSFFCRVTFRLQCLIWGISEKLISRLLSRSFKGFQSKNTGENIFHQFAFYIENRYSLPFSTSPPLGRRTPTTYFILQLPTLLSFPFKKINDIFPVFLEMIYRLWKKIV